MTGQTDIKQLSKEMAKHVGSFEDIKAFQIRLTTALPSKKIECLKNMM